jgi:hypothetical protein
LTHRNRTIFRVATQQGGRRAGGHHNLIAQIV